MYEKEDNIITELKLKFFLFFLTFENLIVKKKMKFRDENYYN